MNFDHILAREFVLEF